MASEKQLPPGALGPAYLGTFVAVAVLGFVGLGWYLDHRRGGGLAFTFGGLGLAMVTIIYEVWKVSRQDLGEGKQPTDKP